jgi:hypothetical protein
MGMKEAVSGGANFGCRMASETVIPVDEGALSRYG